MVSTARKKTPDEVKSWLKKSFFTATDAKERGMVDAITYVAEIRAKLKEQYPRSELISAGKYFLRTAEVDEPFMIQNSDKVGYIEAFGTIVSNSGKYSDEAVVYPELMEKQVTYMLEDDSIKAVVMRVVSPGGSAIASDEIWASMKRLAEKKPLVVSMGGVAASGGYYIAAPAHKILADPTTITGSIGVIAGIPHGQKAEEKWGLNFYTISESERKQIFDLGSPMTEGDKKVLGHMVDDFYSTFLARVAEGRKQTSEAIHQLAQGRVYSGVEALSNGLVDEIGGLREAFDAAKKLAKLEMDRLYPIESYKPEPKNMMECILRGGDMVKCFAEIQEISLQLDKLISPSLPVLCEVEAVKQTINTLSSGEPVLAFWPGAMTEGSSCYRQH
jgi:protease-4